jgi:hypothetical protein
MNDPAIVPGLVTRLLRLLVQNRHLQARTVFGELHGGGQPDNPRSDNDYIIAVVHSAALSFILVKLEIFLFHRGVRSQCPQPKISFTTKDTKSTKAS